MGRDTGPRERHSRREGIDLELLGARRMAGKGGLARRGDRAPGQHGERRRKVSLFGQQLRAKQQVKRFYGVRERQFRRLVDEAGRDPRSGIGGLATLLERRLDNVLVRAGFAVTRRQARQFVVHGHVRVDGARVDIPSYRVRVGEAIAIDDGSPIAPLATAARTLVARTPAWLGVDAAETRAVVLRLPQRDEIQAPIDDRLVVESYRRG